MNVTYSESVRQRGEEFALVQQGTKRLEDVLGPSAGQATAEWDRTQDAYGHVLFTLRLRDFTSEVTARLAPEELQSPAQTSFRMLRVRGDLLQAHLQKQFDDLSGNGDCGEDRRRA